MLDFSCQNIQHDPSGSPAALQHDPSGFADLPWSLPWPIGLLGGIWTLVVLCRPEVIAAFRDYRRDAD